MKIRVAICVPVYDNVESMFFQSLSSMLSYFYETKMRDSETGDFIDKQIETFVCSGTHAQARTRLVYEALQWGPDYLLWLDSDHIFPVDTLNRLIAANKQIVAANYARRVHVGPTSPVASKLDRHELDEKDRLLYTTQEKAEQGLLEKCDHTGMGVCLMHVSVLHDLKKHCEETGEEFFPLFHFDKIEDDNGHVKGEDAYFFEKVRRAGMDIWIDHALSWEVGHIAKHVLTHAHCERQRERWLEREHG